MKISLLLLSLFFITSCAVPMSGDSFQDEVRRISATKTFRSGSPSKILYKGSDEKYHFFKIVPKIGIPRAVKVNKNELQLSEEFKYSDDEEKWLDYELVQ